MKFEADIFELCENADLSDEQFEDLLHAKIRNHIKVLEEQLNNHSNVTSGGPTAPPMPVPHSTYMWGPMVPLADEIEVDFEISTKTALAERKRRKEEGLCYECGDKGEWKAMALFCTKGHGRIAG